MVIVVFVPALLREHLEVKRGRRGGGRGRGGGSRGIGVRMVLVDKAVREQKKEDDERSKVARQEEGGREEGRALLIRLVLPEDVFRVA